VGPDNTTLNNGDNVGTAYYPASSTGRDGGDATVAPLVPTTNQATDTSGSQALRFNVTADTASYTAPSGSGLTYATYIMAFVNSTVTSSSNYYPVPLAFYNSGPGTGGSYVSCQNNCYVTGTGYTVSPPGTTYYFAVPYTAKTTVQVGIYPSDICFLYAGTQLAASGTGAPCTGAAGSGTGAYAYPSPAGATQGFQLKFYIVQVPVTSGGSGFQISPQTQTDTSLNGTGSSNVSLSSDTDSIFLSFQDTRGDMSSCPDQYTQSLYFPGDKSIYLDTTVYRSKYTAPTLSGSGRVAPVNSLYISYTTDTHLTPLAGSSTTPSPTPVYDANPVLARNVGLDNSSELVTGLTNSTAQDPLFYNLSIFMRDAAGFVTTKNCPLSNVQAAEIQGFLKESKCFIATAAFRSMDAAPVRMLRQFRDQVLLQFSLGEAFVNWYYRWSPPAAEWLIDHPGFRYPVLIALVPIEIFAWLCLRPIVFLFFVGASLTLFLLLKKRLADSTRGESI
jgi:hypothetical protein